MAIAEFLAAVEEMAIAEFLVSVEEMAIAEFLVSVELSGLGSATAELRGLALVELETVMSIVGALVVALLGLAMALQECHCKLFRHI